MTMPPLVHSVVETAVSCWIQFRQPPHHPVIRARAALDRILARDEIPGVDCLEPALRRMVSDRHVMQARLVADGVDPEALIYLLVANLAFDELCTGRHHVYRGVLGIRGRELHSAYGAAADRLLAIGVYDRETYDDNAAVLRKEITEIG